MSRFVFTLPDLGEGTVESELVAWHVKAGDEVREGRLIAEMATEKAVIELPSPVTGRVIATHGGPGDYIAVGAPLIEFETGTDEAAAPMRSAAGAEVPPATASARGPSAATAAVTTAAASATRAAAAPAAVRATARPAARTAGALVLTAPATRRLARDAGLDLAAIAGSGPGGRIERRDVEAAIAAAQSRTGGRASLSTRSTVVPEGQTEDIRIIGVRRVIAERVAEAKRSIPHFTYVEEIDVTDLEAERGRRNAARGDGVKLTPLPFVVAALVRVLQDFPRCNARYDAARQVLVRHRSVHVGIATQTADGLKVPVVRNADRLDFEALATEIARVAAAARDNTATREELAGSTITVTSLGRLGGLVSTPVINAPEVAIIGVNRIVERPVVRDGAVVVRRMMNLSSSFDHRFIDGYDAAAMIQALKQRLEDPASIAARPGQ